MVALWLRRPAYVYFSGLLLNVAGTILWWSWAGASVNIFRWDLGSVAGLVAANVICLAIGSIAWSLLRFAHPEGVPHIGEDGRIEPAAHTAVRFGVGLLGVLVAVCVANELLGLRHVGPQRLDWIALAAIAAAALVCLGDRARAAGFVLPSLYGLGLMALGMELLALELPSRRLFCWSAAVELAAFALAVAVVAWIARRGGLVLCQASFDACHGHLARVPEEARARCPWHPAKPQASNGASGKNMLEDAFGEWFSAAQAVVVVVAAGLAAWIALDYGFDRLDGQAALLGTLKLAGRPGSVFTLLLLLGTAIVMVRDAVAGWRAWWQYAAIGLLTLLGCATGWALLPADAVAPWLHRSVIAMTAAAASVFVAGFGPRTVLPAGTDWIERGKRSVLPLAALTALGLVAVLIQECVMFQFPKGTPMMTWAVVVVGVALCGLSAASIALAVWPQLDPLELDDRGRQVYVYAAEVILALFGLHLRFTMPWLFHQYFRPYWMFVVMAVAFVGAGLSEWFRRRKMPVLAEPLERTALLLPLAPAAGFWFLQRLAPTDMPWGLTEQTPLLWFSMGAFYAVLAATRRSLVCTALSVITFNLSLWVALNQYEIGFFRHPQVWLIPVALAGLVAEQFNRSRLSEGQQTAFRYLMLSVIYISSTADMFIAGVANIGRYWWLPLILMVLSVLGALIGILMRIRSFLALGLAFLLVDVLSIIWYAAVDLQHTWIWYACGIGLGAAIIALFAVFEKRRNDVLAAVERLKDWKG